MPNDLINPELFDVTSKITKQQYDAMIQSICDASEKIKSMTSNDFPFSLRLHYSDFFNISSEYNSSHLSSFSFCFEKYLGYCKDGKAALNDFLQCLDAFSSDNKKIIEEKKSQFIDLLYYLQKYSSRKELLKEYCDKYLKKVTNNSNSENTVVHQQQHIDEVNRSEANPSEVNRSEANPSEVNRSEANPSEVNRSEANPSEVNRSEVDLPNVIPNLIKEIKNLQLIQIFKQITRNSTNTFDCLNVRDVLSLIQKFQFQCNFLLSKEEQSRLTPIIQQLDEYINSDQLTQKPQQLHQKLESFSYHLNRATFMITKICDIIQNSPKTPNNRTLKRFSDISDGSFARLLSFPRAQSIEVVPIEQGYSHHDSSLFSPMICHLYHEHRFSYKFNFNRKEIQEIATIIDGKEVPIIEDAEVPIIGDAEVPIIGDAEVPIIGDAEVPIIEDAEVPIIGDAEVPIIEDAEVPIIEDAEISPIIEDAEVSLLHAPSSDACKPCC